MSKLQQDDPIASLEAAAEELRTAEAAVEDVGVDRVHQLADAYGRFDELLSQYRERASGSGRETFKAYVEFEGKLDEFVSELPDDLLQRDAFEDAENLLNRRRLEEADFDRAREELTPVREVVKLLEDREAAEVRYREARHTVELARREAEDEIEALRSVLAFEDVDLDAPVEVLREPIDTYETAVDEAFQTFKSNSSARAVLAFVESTGAYPLVELPEPPDPLRTYLTDHPAGQEPIPTLLSWTEFTRSKLTHYVSDPATFQARVGSNRTYLSGLGAEPLHVGWPPPPAGTLRFRSRELVSVIERFAPVSVVEHLHEVRSLARSDGYGTLRRAAVARARLTDDAWRRLRDGTVRDELSTLQDRRDRLTRALDEYPSPPNGGL